MNTQDIALLLAGLIGAGTAVIHGVLVQRLMVRPFDTATPGDARVPVTIRRLVPILLHFSTAAWLAGGLVLAAVALGWASEDRMPVALFVGTLYLYGALGNLWGVRGRHPGWMLLAAAVGLIALGVA